MSADYTITITSISGGSFVPNTTLDAKATLQATGNPLIKYTGSHLGNGTYKFTAVDDGKYKLFEDVACSTEITKWGGTNGKWIGDDLMEYYASSASVASLQSATASIESEITSLESATASIISRLSNYASLSSTNQFTARNTFEAITVQSDGGNPTSYFSNQVSFTNAPICNSAPSNITHLTNKNYVDNAIASISIGTSGALSATYQQSINVRRLVPAGSQELNRLYTTWSTAVGNAAGYATSAQQYSIMIEGEGNTGDYIELPVHNPTTDYAFYDYVHMKGIGSDIKVKMNISETSSISAGAVGRIVWEDLFVYGDGDNTQSFKNIIFKNCKFYGINDFYFAFVDCKFEGGNSFIGSYAPSFNNCSGERIYSETTPNISGTSKLQYYTPTKIAVGQKTIYESGDSLVINATDTLINSSTLSISGIVNNLGTITPDYYCTININGADYFVPLQLKV